MYRNFLLSSFLTTSLAFSAQAAVTASEAAELGATLTKFGAIPVASADGAIPAYTGGITAMQNLPGPSPTGGYTDPFANEQPLFTVSASNMAQYTAELTPGEMALLQRYPSFHIDVYPTHRTASYPNWVLENTIKNATTAQMVGDGDGVTGAYGGIPFPVPQSGNEVMWNSFLAYRPASCSERSQGYLVDTSGAVTDLGTINFAWATPYYFPGQSTMDGDFWRYFVLHYVTPPAQAGRALLFKYPIDFTKSDDVTWFYTTGTRRVRLAPEYRYDTPAAAYGGAIDYDETNLFYGRMDKFDFHLVGEKEMIVPYNDYKMSNTTVGEMLGPQTINPDMVRWERHRVWVVDATLKPNERHIYSRWTFYIDEDSWEILASESYDHSNTIYRVGFAYPFQNYTQGDGAVAFADEFGFYDLSKGNYEISAAYALPGDFWQCSTQKPDMTNFTPQAMAAESVR